MALSAVPAHAATPTSPAAPTAKLAYTAKILITTNVFKQPGHGIKLRLPTHAAWGGGPHVLLVLDSREYKGKTWLRVRAARPPERLERLDPRGFRASQDDARGASRSTVRRIS